MKVSISADVVSEVADGEVVLLDLKRGIYYALDPVGSRFWGLLQAGGDLEGARQCLLGEYDVSPEQLSHDLDRLLADLSGRGLVQCREG
jgi:Coenzyme PQQ synthesis protein D (PqqD)